jgi:hypothetical protein
MIAPSEALELARQFRLEVLEEVNRAHRSYAAVQRWFFMLDRVVSEADSGRGAAPPDAPTRQFSV